VIRLDSGDCVEDLSLITGAMVVVDGGMTSRMGLLISRVGDDSD